uniref:Uncharacterized protein n=1 Tax=Monopterus albus TaxID=43700 RepID=A0A3Q3JX81_MONAL
EGSAVNLSALLLAREVPRKAPHIPEPDTFDGNVKSCRGFLLQCRRVFDHQPRTYITDREKISYIINLFSELRVLQGVCVVRSM